MRYSRIPQKLTRYRLHRARLFSSRRKPRKTAHFQVGNMRAVFVVAGDTLPSGVDNQQQCRPQEIPTNSHIAGGAGDAVGILQRPTATTSWSFCVSSELSAYGSHKASLNDFVADERVLEVPEDPIGKAAAQICLYAHPGQDKSKACQIECSVC
jgi:hypothetical protein